MDLLVGLPALLAGPRTVLAHRRVPLDHLGGEALHQTAVAGIALEALGGDQVQVAVAVGVATREQQPLLGLEHPGRGAQHELGDAARIGQRPALAVHLGDPFSKLPGVRPLGLADALEPREALADSVGLARSGRRRGPRPQQREPGHHGRAAGDESVDASEATFRQRDPDDVSRDRGQHQGGEDDGYRGLLPAIHGEIVAGPAHGCVDPGARRSAGAANSAPGSAATAGEPVGSHSSSAADRADRTSDRRDVDREEHSGGRRGPVAALIRAAAGALEWSTPKTWVGALLRPLALPHPLCYQSPTVAGVRWTRQSGLIAADAVVAAVALAVGAPEAAAWAFG